MIREYRKLEDIPSIQEQLSKIDYKQIREIFLQSKAAKVDEIKFNQIDYSGIVNYLANERSFSKDRVDIGLNRLKKALEKKSQNLEQWF